MFGPIVDTPEGVARRLYHVYKHMPLGRRVGRAASVYILLDQASEDLCVVDLYLYRPNGQCDSLNCTLLI